MERLEKRLKDRKIEICISDAAVKLLANLGYDPSYGARPVKRVIQQNVENALAKGILKGDFGEDDIVDIDVEILGPANGGLPTQKLTFTRVPRVTPSAYDPLAYMPM
jgi:ATP-dependent Clp protease ATP-binding subunit ClpB